MSKPEQETISNDSALCQESTDISNTFSIRSLALEAPSTDSEPSVEDYGVKIQWIRCSAKLTQQAFGTAVGVSGQTIGAIERGEREPYRSTVALIAEYIDVPVDELADFLSGNSPLRNLPRPMRNWIQVDRVSGETTVTELAKMAGGLDDV